MTTAHAHRVTSSQSARTVREASPKQRAFIVKLAGELTEAAAKITEPNNQHQVRADVAASVVAAWVNGDTLTAEVASNTIDALLGYVKEARRAIPQGAPIVEAGFYLFNDEVVKVQKAVHGSGQLYAKRLVIGSTGDCAGHETLSGAIGDVRYCDGTCQPEADRTKWTQWEYAPGLVRQLRPEHKLTKEQAQAFGQLYGVCCICGATLTDETSIAAGIGPICGKRWN